MMPENPKELPQIDSAKFMEMGPWVKQSFDQLKDKVEISAGDGDQAIISVAMESFAKDVAYSGVLAAYERSQISSWLRGDGPLATKFDLLIHHFDSTKELLTNTEARREVQAVIVNLCGGKERYKFLYEAGAENYQVADAVKTVVEQWGEIKSKQAQIDNLGRQPEKAVNGEIPVVNADEVYNGLNEKGRKAIDAFAAKFLEEGADLELVQDLIVLVPDLKTAADYIPGGSKALIEKMDLPNDLKKELGVLLNLKPIPKGKITIEKRVEQAIANNQLYSQIDQVINWRMSVLKERHEVKQRINGKAETLNFRLEEGKAGPTVEVTPELKQLVEEAVKLGIDLPAKVLFADAGLEKIGEISVTLNKNWEASRGSFEYKPFTQRTADMLAAAETLHGAEFGNGYSLTKDESGKFKLLKGDEQLAEVNALEGGQIVFNWVKNTAVDQGLTAMAVFGQGLNDHFAKGETFPSLYLEFKAPDLSVATEPTGTVLVGQKTEFPKEETSGSDLEVPEPAPSEEGGFWKNFDVPSPAKPEFVAPEPKQESALIDTSFQAPETPDWLKALQEEDGRGQAAQAPSRWPETEAENEPDLYEIFDDKRPVEAVTSARKPIEIVAQAIRERGGADFEFDQTSTHNLFYGTLDNIVHGIYVPGLTIDHFGISEFNISGGQIRLTVNAGGSFKKIISVPVSASMSFGLSSGLDLLGEPSINLPSLAPKEAKGLIINQLRQIKAELSRTIIRGLSANKITNSSVENINIQNSSLLATIRGKVSR